MTSPVDFISGPKYRVRTGELDEREYGFLDREVRRLSLVDEALLPPAIRPP